MLTIILLILWAASGIYIAYKSQMIFSYYLHKRYCLVTPIIEDPDSFQWTMIYISAIFGPFSIIGEYFIRKSWTTEFTKEDWKNALNCKVGDKFFYKDGTRVASE